VRDGARDCVTVRVGESVRLDHRYAGKSAKQCAKGVNLDRSVYWSQAHQRFIPYTFTFMYRLSRLKSGIQ